MCFKRIQILLTIVALAFGQFYLSGCGKKDAGGMPHGGMVVSVVGFKVVKQSIEDKISLVGTLEANEVVEIKNEIDGTLEQINFEEGQKVKNGDLLFSIDQRKLKATVDQAEANLKLAQTTKERYESLTQTGAISRQEFDQAAATLEINKASLLLVQDQLQDATILAPFDGIMGERLVSAGQFIPKGTSLGFVVSQDPIKASFRIPEKYLSEIKVGQKITMKVAAYPDEQFSGEVFFIDPKVDELTRTALVKATLPNPEGQLRHGMFANLQLIVHVKKDALVIPETALIVKGDSVQIFTINDDQTAAIKTVNTGIRMAGLVEVTDNLKEGETVVVEGFQKLAPGMKTQIRYEDKPHALTEMDSSHQNVQENASSDVSKEKT